MSLPPVRLAVFWFASLLLVSSLSGAIAQDECSDPSLAITIDASTLATYVHCPSLSFALIAIDAKQGDHLHLPNLLSVTGHLKINAASQGFINLPALANVTGDVTINNWQALPLVMLPTLASISNHFIIAESNFTATRMPKLEHVGGDFRLRGCYDRMESQSNFPTLQTIGSLFVIEDSPSVVIIDDFPSLISADYIHIANNQRAVRLYGLNKVTQLHGISLMDNQDDVVVDEGFQALHTTTFEISIKNNEYIVNLKAFAHLTQMKELKIDHRRFLLLGSMLDKLERIDRLELTELDLIDFKFPALTTVTDTLTITVGSSLIRMFTVLTAVPKLVIRCRIDRGASIMGSFNAPGLQIASIIIDSQYGSPSVMEISNSFNSLQTVEDLWMLKLKDLDTFKNSFLQLRSISRSFQISEWPATIDMTGSLIRLASVADLLIEKTSLTNLDFLYALRSVTNDLQLTRNRWLSSISGLCNLRLVRGSNITIADNALCCRDLNNLFDQNFINTAAPPTFSKCQPDAKCPFESESDVCACDRMESNPCEAYKLTPYCKSLRHGAVCTAPSSPASPKKLSGAVIAVIVLAVVLVLAAGVFVCYRRYKQSQASYSSLHSPFVAME